MSSKASKRRRVETVDENDDDEASPSKKESPPEEEALLQMMMMHQTCSKPDEDEATRQEERERKRRERQARIQRQEKEPPVSSSQAVFAKPVKKEEEEVVVDVAESSNAMGGEAVVMDEHDNGGGDDDDDDDDDFDMFSSSVSPITTNTTARATTTTTTTKTDDFQDAEGYYKASIGENFTLQNKQSFTVLGVVGKGVFSTVLKCSTTTATATTQAEGVKAAEQTVALKFIRHNETMSRAAEKEVQFLRKLQHAHIVQLLEIDTNDKSLLEHNGHVVMVFPYLPYTLRDVLQKFGKGVGLSLQACKSYFLQLLSALRHLEKHSIIHADIKPDNMLVTKDFSTIQLCDFGSAMTIGSADAVPTPYLVSRFYRAPEVILGAVPSPALDLWSVGTTIGEVYLGHVLFAGKNNNDMLRAMMQVLGPFSGKTIRQHLVQVKKLGLPLAHFRHQQQNYLYLQQTNLVTSDNRQVVKEMSLDDGTFPSKSILPQRLLKAKSQKDSRLFVQKFATLLQKVLSLEATRRISVADAMKHEFFAENN